MKRDDILKRLKEAEVGLRARGVARAALFGSVARGDDRPGSGIDIMVEFSPEARVGIWGYVGVQHYIRAFFLERVDVIDREGLKPYMMPHVAADVLYAF